MTITVIIPVYNAENYLCRCVESVRCQTYIDWQMILVDDGSNDGSLAICQMYAEKDDRIQVIHQTNSGAGSARNAGLENALGKYIVFIDSDDYVARDYFYILSKHDEDIVFIDVEALNEDGAVVRKEYMSSYRKMSKDDFMRAQMTGKINWGGVRKVVKREIIENNHIRYSNHKVGEEALFTYCSIFYSKTIAFIDKPVYYYTQRKDSLSHTIMDDPWGNVAIALKMMTIKNNSYANYADTVNAFILTAASVSSNHLALNYSKSEYKRRVDILYSSLMTNLDNEYPIDYKHMSLKAKMLGKLLIGHHFELIRVISKVKQLFA